MNPPDGGRQRGEEQKVSARPSLTEQKYKVSLAGKLLPESLETPEVGYCEAGRVYGTGKWLLLGDACGEDAKTQINSQETQTGLLAALTFTVASACLFALDGNRDWELVAVAWGGQAVADVFYAVLRVLYFLAMGLTFQATFNCINVLLVVGELDGHVEAKMLLDRLGQRAHVSFFQFIAGAIVLTHAFALDYVIFCKSKITAGVGVLCLASFVAIPWVLCSMFPLIQCLYAVKHQSSINPPITLDTTDIDQYIENFIDEIGIEYATADLVLTFIVEKRRVVRCSKVPTVLSELTKRTVTGAVEQMMENLVKKEVEKCKVANKDWAPRRTQRPSQMNSELGRTLQLNVESTRS